MTRNVLNRISVHARRAMVAAVIATTTITSGFVVTNVANSLTHVSVASSQRAAPPLLPIGMVLVTVSNCTYWSDLTVYVRGYAIALPSGQQCMYILKSGTYVTGILGRWTSAYLYNSVEVVRFYDTYGNNYRTGYGRTYWGYAYGQDSHMEILNAYVRTGRVCVAVLSAGTTVATACEQIR